MTFLLDTQIFLWWSLDEPRIPGKVRTLIADPANHLLLSAASAWEIAIKVRIGKLKLPQDVATYIPDRVAQHRMRVLPVSLPHAIETAALPLHHGDPFDRLLIAQSRVEGVPIVTADPHFKNYPVEVIW